MNTRNGFFSFCSRYSLASVLTCGAIVFSSAVLLAVLVPSCGPEEPSYRTIDGYNNNLNHPEMNQAEVGVQLIRKVPPAYDDGISALITENRPNARKVSNIVMDQPDDRSIPNPKNASDFFWLWGQFLSHDISFVPEFRPHEQVHIRIPVPEPGEDADPFDPGRTGIVDMPFNRALFDLETGTSADNPRQQVNEISGWLDATNIYSNNSECLTELRANDGTGRLKIGDGNLLPHADDPEFCFVTVDDFFLSGDERVNEHIGLTSINTVFVLEHNRLADEIREKNPDFSGDETFNRARNIVAAQIQKITYEDFLPLLLGERLPEYKGEGYNDQVNAGVANVWAVAGFRLGHTLLSTGIRLLDEDGNDIRITDSIRDEDGNDIRITDENGNKSLRFRDAFREPEKVADIGIEPILRGFASQVCQKIDIFIRDEFRNFLFGFPGRTGNPVIGSLDLASLNIQRGRDHGIADYNTVREAYGLPRNEGFSDISSDSEVQDRLKKAYGTTENIDLWVGGLAEDPKEDSMLGELFHAIIVDQFIRLRNGDRFWYERSLSAEELNEVRNATLGDIIIRSTNIKEGEIQDDVFICDESCKTP